MKVASATLIVAIGLLLAAPSRSAGLFADLDRYDGGREPRPETREQPQPPSEDPEALDEEMKRAATEMVKKPRTWGVGTSVFGLLSPIVGGGIIVTREIGLFQLDLGTGFEWRDNESIALGVGGRIHIFVHRFPRADFSVGLGGGYRLIDPEEPGDVDHQYVIEATAKIRVFVHQRVGLLAILGVAARISDQGNAVSIGGLPLGALGFIYYF